jgi:hypothetical protein
MTSFGGSSRGSIALLAGLRSAIEVAVATSRAEPPGCPVRRLSSCRLTFVGDLAQSRRSHQGRPFPISLPRRRNGSSHGTGVCSRCSSSSDLRMAAGSRNARPRHLLPVPMGSLRRRPLPRFLVLVHAGAFARLSRREHRSG